MVDTDISLKELTAALDAAPTGQYMPSLQGLLSSLFDRGLQTAFPGAPRILSDAITPGTASQFGDYQCTSACGLVKILRRPGTNLGAQEIANRIVRCLPNNEIIDRIEIRNGFINIYLKKPFISRHISDLTNGVRPPLIEAAKKKIIVDFSSPNISKEMHVGHLRSTIIGDCLCNLWEFIGYEVQRINHIGDWGNHAGQLVANILENYGERIDDSLSIEDLQKIYLDSKKRVKEDTEFKKRVGAAAVALQNGDPNHRRVWKIIRDVSVREFRKIYDRLDIRITERGESFYQEYMMRVVTELEQKGLARVEDGRTVMSCEGHTKPLTLVKTGGSYTYYTSDMAALRHRLHEENADWIFYVVDIGQSEHLKMIFAGGQVAGWYTPAEKRVEHIDFGLVLGNDKKKLKTRSGDAIRLVELLDEGITRFEERLKNKKRNKELSPDEFLRAKEALAYGCIKYADLSQRRGSDYVFSFDKMLQDRENTAIYIFYAYTRIRSITRLAGVSNDELQHSVASGATVICLDDENEWTLSKCLMRFADAIMNVAKTSEPHHLCKYLQELSRAFTKFYDYCYCVEKDAAGNITNIHMSRLLLCEATANVMAKGLQILGLRTIDCM